MPGTTRRSFHSRKKTDQRAYLIEYLEEQMEAKFDTLLESLRNRFEVPVTSHRSGRWALDERYAALLAKKGFHCRLFRDPAYGLDYGAGQTGLPVVITHSHPSILTSCIPGFLRYQ